MDPNDLVPCSVCGRKFAEDALERHESICMKVHSKQRKQFDSSKKRVEGTELSSFKKPLGTQKKAEVAQKKKSNWKETHLEFINSIRAARGIQQAIKSGKPLPPPPPPSKNPDYVQCDFCGRRFNEKAAERHVPFCKSQQERLPKGRGSQASAQKQAARINYQPPVPLRSRQSGEISRVEYSEYDDAYKYSSKSETSSHKTLPSLSSKSETSSSKALPRNGVGVNSSRATNHTTAASQRNAKGSSGQPTANDRLGKTQDRTPSGPALRTGRTSQTYTDTKQLSAKQWAAANSASRKYPSSDNISPCPRYPTHGHLPSSQSHHWTGTSTVSGINDHHHTTGDARFVGSGRAATGGRGSALFGTATGTGVAGGRLASKCSSTVASPSGVKFCNECGAKFATATSKFCSECGTRKCP